MTKRHFARLFVLLCLLGALCVSAAAVSWYDDDTDLPSADTTTVSEDSSDADAPQSAADAFSDVPAAQWYYEYVDKLYTSGVVGGFPDGTFRPQNNVTTGQALKMILLAAGYAEPDPVSSHWARGYLDLALAQSILDRGDITDLDVPITRAMMAKIAANALGLRRTDEADYFTDTKDDYVHALYEYGIVGGYTDGTYKPAKKLTRAEVSAIVCRIQDFLGLDEIADGDDPDEPGKNVPSNFISSRPRASAPQHSGTISSTPSATARAASCTSTRTASRRTRPTSCCARSCMNLSRIWTHSSRKTP